MPGHQAVVLFEGAAHGAAVGLDRERVPAVVDFVLSWDPRPGRPVDLLQVDEVIETIAKMYNVRRVTFDRWNSAPSIQKLVAMGIDADDMNFSNEDQIKMYRYLRMWFSNAMIELPPGDEATRYELRCGHGKVRARALDPGGRGSRRRSGPGALGGAYRLRRGGWTTA